MPAPRRQLLLFFLVVIAASALTCYATNRVLHHRAHGHDHAHGPGDHHHHDDPHQWLHQRLAITAEQERALEPTERRFAAERTRWTAEIRAANRELAASLREEGARYTPRVEAAIERSHHAQGELQKAAIRHVLEMPPALTPEQGRKLLDLTAEALDQGPGN